MDKEIKFKAYHKNWKRMFDVEALFFDSNEVLIEISPDFSDLEEIVRIELSQFTGKKDKNEVEIYDNWIVRSEKYGITGLAYIDDDYGFVISGIHRTARFKQEDLTVLGNLFENPELLEVT